VISVVCPFYNEAAILEGAIEHMLGCLATLEDDWELIVVNDGSRDDSLHIARGMEARSPRLRVLSYPHNQGRGYALRTGIAAARGEIVVTTEVDCSWGDDIVHRIAREFRAHPQADMVVASPNLQGGGYRNVPGRRVAISRLGNTLLRFTSSTKLTMYTGMTRGYRRERFLELPIDENEKEFHLDVARKAFAFNFRIREVPAVLEWKSHRLVKQEGAARKSSSRIPKLMRTHLLFSLAAAPFRYLFPLALLIGLAGLAFFAGAVRNLFTDEPSAFYALMAMALFLFAFLMLGLAILAHQGLDLLQNIWRLRSELLRSRSDADSSK
jgi:glycosyltransferase involved in cell wall biosynthesis